MLKSAMYERWLLICVILVCSLAGALSQEYEESDVRCVGETSCATCLAGAPNCSWCKQRDFKAPRCDRAEVLEQLGCQNESIYLRGASEFQVDSDLQFSDYVGKDFMKAVQLKPQKAHITLTPGDPVTIPLKFRAARNYPLDVYYLMDLTWSMRDDKETLASLGDDLANALANMTRNFRLGFGSFVDKPLMPFVNQARLENPCSAERETCSPAYGFRHHLSLSRDTVMFTDNVRDAAVSGNLDNAEGGLDALMQVLACHQHVGWAKDSRKIVILASDGILHFAGDGKLAGAVRNNDVKCHLDPKTGLYTKSDELDYPSLGQIDSLLLKNKVSMIFAVTKDRIEHYARLSEVLLGVHFVAALEEDSSNIIQLVNQGYKNIVSSVSFSDNAKDPIKISYESNCKIIGQTGELISTQSCDRIEEGEEYQFNLTFKFDKCPEDSSQWNQKVKIEERGLVSGLQLDITLKCGCSCEENELESEQCGGHGDLNCGVCDCHQGWYGPICSCSERNATSIVELEVGCLPADAALQGAEICWGRGECVCGECACHGGAYGRFCECDDSACANCGPHGRCQCGRCQCDPGWEGRQCACPTATDTCVAPGDSRPCSGKGRCECGRCVCDAELDGSARYTGRFCENCDTCAGLCALYKSCVNCKVFDEDCPEDEDVNPCFTNSSASYIDIVRDLQISEEQQDEFCVFRDKKDCFFKFTYSLDEDRKVRLRVLSSKTCPQPLNAAAMAGSIMIAVVLLGLLLILMWRCIVAAKDKRDYKRFEQAASQANFSGGNNPIYKPATRYYEVPQGFQEPREPETPLVVTPNSPLFKVSAKNE